MAGHRGTFIENEAAYEEAIRRNIQANGRKTRERKFRATESGALIWNLMFQTGEFEATRGGVPLSRMSEEDYWALCDERGLAEDRGDMAGVRAAEAKLRFVEHPLVKALHGAFWSKMFDSLQEWGSLTPGQEAAVLKMIEKARERLAGREVERAKQAEADQASQFIGEVGQRLTFAHLTVRRLHSFDTMYGTSHLHVMADEAGNVVVYKGSTVLGDRGATITVTATVKDHDIREGVRQTIINRPKLLPRQEAAGQD